MGEANSTAYSDPVALPLLSTEWTDLVPTGSQYKRVEKVDRILKEVVPRRFLNVCTSPQLELWNCSKCPKCARTLLTAEALGYLPEMGESFDLDTYRRCRDYYVSVALRSKKVLWREVAELMRARGMAFHPIRKTALYSLALKISSSVRRHLSKRFRAVSLN